VKTQDQFFELKEAQKCDPKEAEKEALYQMSEYKRLRKIPEE